MILIEDPLLTSYIKYQCKLLARDKRTYEVFPGSQPISFTRKPARDEEYMVAEKTDGVRYLLLLLDNDLYRTGLYGHTFLIGRKFDIWGMPKMIKKWNPIINKTLLDGELVEDNGQPVYYIFDTLSIGDTFFGNMNFQDRIIASQMNFLPYVQQGIPAITTKIIYEATAENIRNLFEIIKTLPHGNDGLIFTRNDKPYEHGSSRHVLKWKPIEEATVDFVVEEGPNGRYSKLIGFVMDSSFHYDNIELSDDEISKIEAIPGPIKVIEVRMNCDTKKWEFSRTRPDKIRGNEITTIYNVLESIKLNITQDKLIGFFL